MARTPIASETSASVAFVAPNPLAPLVSEPSATLPESTRVVLARHRDRRSGRSHPAVKPVHADHRPVIHGVRAPTPMGGVSTNSVVSVAKVAPRPDVIKRVAAMASDGDVSKKIGHEQA